MGRRDGLTLIFSSIQNILQVQGREDEYNQSLLYFWVTMVHFGMSQKASSAPPSTEAKQDEPLSVGFEAFLVSNYHLVNEEHYKNYFSEESFQKSKSSQEIVLPDLKPLPSVIDTTKS